MTNQSETPSQRPRKNVEITVLPSDSIEETGAKVAKIIASSAVSAQRIMGACEGRSSFGELLDVPTLTSHLEALSSNVSAGDMSRVEEMLICQAVSLQSLFTRMMEKAMSTEALGVFNDFMKVGLRAQNQSRMTLETLATIRNPPNVFAKQMNLAVNQQINNATPSGRRNQTQQSKLLEKKDEQWVDAGAKSPAIRVDSAMGALEEVDWPKDENGACHCRKKR